jgi:6-pyruvoyltetrahydropterin/6-carboxytetrahydropterin synthase
MSAEASESWSIQVAKDYLKFSAAHFLIFPDGTAERLHGHNYKVYVEVHSGLDPHGLVVNFKEIKPIVRTLSDSLDEHVIMPGRHPALAVERVGEVMEIRYRERRYSIPADEVIVLPVSNTSAENLASWIGRELHERLRAKWPGLRVAKLVVGVEETTGQRGVWTRCENARA